MIRKAIEQLYVGRCRITNRQKTVDPVTKITSFKDVVLCEDEPCRLSYSTISRSSDTDTITNVNQVVKLFLRPELVVDAGSKITVTQNGRTTNYVASGQSAVYTNHQEILLGLGDNKA